MSKEYFREISIRRPTPLKRFDQVYMDEKHIMSTCMELDKITRDKRLLFIGDDDLLSIYLSTFCSPKSVEVIDLDARIIRHIRTLKKKFGLKNLRVAKYDVRDSLPANFINSFDVFYVNPPYGSKNNGDSCIAFIMRGLESLKVGGQGVFVIASGSDRPWAKKAEEKVLNYVRKSGCRILRRSTANQTYVDNRIRSTLFVVEKNKDAVLPVQINKISLY